MPGVSDLFSVRPVFCYIDVKSLGLFKLILLVQSHINLVG